MTTFKGKGALMNEHGQVLGTITEMELTLEGESFRTLDGRRIDPDRVKVDRAKGIVTVEPGGDHSLGDSIIVGFTRFVVQHPRPKVRRIAQWKREQKGRR